MRSFLMVRYVLGEMIPTFFLGVIVFVFILLMFQALRLTEFVIVHGVKLSSVAMMMAYMSTSFLPILFPMSLLFAVLLTYSRLSSDSEIVAFRASGLSMPSIITPAIVLATLVGVLSLQTSFHLAPWGNRQFELLFAQLGSLKPGVALREGAFSEGFFDMVVYANKVDANRGKLSQVFIYDERQQPAMTIIANEGDLAVDKEHPGRSALLQLRDGSIHRTSAGRHTKIDFSTYQVFLSDSLEQISANKSAKSLTLQELQSQLDSPEINQQTKIELKTEFHTRIAISFTCLLFALIGVGLGTVSNGRNVKGGSTVICLGLIVTYWILFVATESLSHSGHLAPAIAMWIPNTLFAGAAAYSLRRAWD